MPVDLNSTEGSIIRKLVPLATLSNAPLKALFADMVIEEVQDDFLFKKGDIDTKLVYLISGTVSLQAHGLVIDIIDAKNESARFALAHQIPRKIDALAKGVVRFLRLDADTINNPAPLVYKEDDNYLVVEEADDNTQDWMTSLLKFPIFQNLNPANLQKILISVEAVTFRKGKVILEQGNTDEHYYLIKSGTCLITHKPTPDGKDVKQAQIGKGNTLGEDALIFDSPRTETVTALTDVDLLRLSKKHFISLIKEPVLKFIGFLEMQKILMTGATMLDIRTQDQYRTRHLNGSVNVPFFLLRTRLKIIHQDNPVIVIGNNDKTSEAAAFLLIKCKYEVFILQGGINEIIVAPENESIFFNNLANFSKSQHNNDWKEQPIDSEVDFFESPNKTDFEIRMSALISENVILKKANEDMSLKYEQLKINYEQIKADKDNAEKQCRMLSKQVDKLTHVLNKFKIAKTKPDEQPSTLV